MLPTNVRLDPYTTYSVVMNEVENRSRVIINIDRIVESDNLDEVVVYTKKDLEEYWKTRDSESMHLKTVNTENHSHKRYFLLDVMNALIFIPLSNKDKNIINFTVINISYLNKIVGRSFCLSISNPGKKYAKKYAKSRSDLTLHAIIFGRKATKGFKLDHKNSDSLDNRIENIRELTDLENTVNINTANKLRGICWRPKHSKREEAIKINRKCHYI